MKQLILAVIMVSFGVISNAQTPGILTLQFTQTPHSSYSGNRNVMAVWIQTSAGAFVKTCTRNVGTGTKDHLPTWASNSGGTASNALGSGCNVQGAITGATYTSFSTRTITWDGTDASGNYVADGTYKITVQSTWNHGGGGTATRTYTFTKGTTNDNQTPVDDGNFTSISLDWIASGVGIEEVKLNTPEIRIFPNPSNSGQFNLEYAGASEYVVVDIAGNIVSEGKLETNGIQVIDLSEQGAGNYFIQVSNGTNNSVSQMTISE